MRKLPTVLFQKGTVYDTPFSLLKHVKGEPQFDFYTTEKVNPKTGEIKKRIIANPNQASRLLHSLFLNSLRFAMGQLEGKSRVLITQPSATAFKPESWHVKNTAAHLQGEHFFITDVHNAYANVNLELLARLLVYIFHYHDYKTLYGHDAILHSDGLRVVLEEDYLYQPMYEFLKIYFGGKYGQGLVFGGVASPFLFNLYMEVFVDSPIRALIARRQRHEQITYTRYADDLVFSSLGYIGPDLRKKIERVLGRVGLSLNRLKTKVLRRSQGTVFVTKTGIGRTENVLTFPQQKRRALRQRLHLFLTDKLPALNEKGKSNQEVTRGYVAEFLGYLRERGTPTKSDMKTLQLCHAFEEMAGKRKTFRS